jgi:hypothetical protein
MAASAKPAKADQKLRLGSWVESGLAERDFGLG